MGKSFHLAQNTDGVTGWRWERIDEDNDGGMAVWELPKNGL
jgi:hypothetical protein